MPVKKMLCVIRHVPHSPSSLMFFDNEEEALSFQDPDGGHIEWWAGSDGVRHVIGTWMELDLSLIDPQIVVSQPEQIYHYWSDEDGYLAGVVLARTENEARLAAFEALKESRSDDWMHYHPDPSGIQVEALGRHGGSGDGEGNIEFF